MSYPAYSLTMRKSADGSMKLNLVMRYIDPDLAPIVLSHLHESLDQLFDAVSPYELFTDGVVFDDDEPTEQE